MQTGNRNRPATTYVLDQQTYHSSSIVAVYAVELSGGAPDCFKWLQHIQITFTVAFVTFVAYDNN